jgi:hypothetical protein
VRTKLSASLPADEVPIGQDAGKESQRRLSSMNSRIESGTSPNST